MLSMVGPRARAVRRPPIPPRALRRPYAPSLPDDSTGTNGLGKDERVSLKDPCLLGICYFTGDSLLAGKGFCGHKGERERTGHKVPCDGARLRSFHCFFLLRSILVGGHVVYQLRLATGRSESRRTPMPGLPLEAPHPWQLIAS